MKLTGCQQKITYVFVLPSTTLQRTHAVEISSSPDFPELLARLHLLCYALPITIALQQAMYFEQ
jgi:hypothetical protein